MHPVYIVMCVFEGSYIQRGNMVIQGKARIIEAISFSTL